MAFVFGLAIAMTLVAVGCSQGEDNAGDETTVPATALPTTIAPSTTAAPTTTVEIVDEPLVLLAFGDSIISYPSTFAGVIGVYAGMLEEEFGVPVDVRDRTVWGSPPDALLDVLGTEWLHKDLAEADVVLLEIPQGDTNPAFPTATGWHEMDPADCGGDDNQQCLRDYVVENKATVEAIFDELTAMWDPSETLIRAIDVYMLHVGDSHASGTLHILNPYLQETQEYLEETAAKYGIPVAQVFDEYMGPDGTDDPQDRGLVMADQRHPTEAGAQLIAEMLHDLGYDLAD